MNPSTSSKRLSLLDSMRRDEQEPSPDVMKSFVKSGRVETKKILPEERLLADQIEVSSTTEGAPSLSVSKSKPVLTKPRPSRINPVALVPVTVRLRPELAGALKRASLERELSGEAVYTQQDIVEEALLSWLKRAGML
jgi:hypothetical protein